MNSLISFRDIEYSIISYVVESIKQKDDKYVEPNDFEESLLVDIPNEWFNIPHRFKSNSSFEFQYTERVAKCHESNEDCEEPLIQGISNENVDIPLREKHNINSSFEFESTEEQVGEWRETNDVCEQPLIEGE